MKTAVSIPDKIFERAETFAKKKKLSRSHLFAEAVEDYLNKHDEDEVTANLNKVYATEDSSVDPVLFKMALLSLPKEEW